MDIMVPVTCYIYVRMGACVHVMEVVRGPVGSGETNEGVPGAPVMRRGHHPSPTGDLVTFYLQFRSH